jgi:undecaprenyl-diphosphatase
MNAKSKRAVWISGIVLFFFMIALYFDAHIIRGVSYIKNAFLDVFFMGLTSASSGIIILFFLTILLVWSGNKRRWILPLWFTLALSYLASFILKIIIERPRPFQQGLIEIPSFLVKNSYYMWDFSFPSSHAMIAFCAVPILSKEFPKFKYAWIALASLIALSRLYLGFHFLSDIIAGAFFGYVIGMLVMKAEKENRFWEKVYWRIRDRFMK